MNEGQTNPLGKSFNALSLIKFALPSMVMMMFMGLYTIVDTIFVARFVDTYALSAVNIVCPVINVIVGTGTMLAAGGSAVIARKMGCGKIKEARSNFTLVIVTGAGIGLAVTAAGFLFMDEIIWGLGASEVLFPYCRDYLAVQLMFAVGNMMQVLYQNLFVTAGRPALGMLLSVSAGCANIIFDYIFIVLLQMGIKGAALGTGIGYMIPACVGSIFFLSCRNISGKAAYSVWKMFEGCELYFCRFQMDSFFLIQCCLNGASEMVSQLSAAVTTFLFNAVMMKLLEEDGVAAITVIIYSQFLLTTLYIGFSMGAAPVISYNYGSKNIKQLRKVVRTCFCFIISISCLVFLSAFLAGENIAGIFAENNKNMFEITKAGFTIFSFSFLFSGCNIFASALFTALSKGRESAVISFLRTFGFVTVLLLVLPEFFGAAGVWFVLPGAEMLTFAATGYFIYREKGLWKKKL